MTRFGKRHAFFRTILSGFAVVHTARRLDVRGLSSIFRLRPAHHFEGKRDFAVADTLLGVLNGENRNGKRRVTGNRIGRQRPQKEMNDGTVRHLPVHNRDVSAPADLIQGLNKARSDTSTIPMGRVSK